jgi:superfamily II DNA/RNA helicase
LITGHATTRGEENHVFTFQQLGVPADLVAALRDRNITEPFPVQTATIPDALAGQDVCGKAPTGSGKTLAFGVPLVVRVASARPRRPRALVLAPTRELASQIHKDLEPLAVQRNKRVCTVYGGVGYEKQKKALRRGVEILVACPGRLRDLVAQHAVRLDAVDIVVIDEADRMADMGFLPEVRRILDETSPARQTVLFSATLDGDVAVLQHEYQRADAVNYEIASTTDNATIDHRFEELQTSERAARAAEIVRAHGSTIVFTRTRRGAERLAKQLTTAGVGAAAIHGGLSQSKRDRALAGFKNDRVEALIATDVAARGIHVDAVACVVHFDLPEDAKTYIHRSGRTARAGATGTVVSFVARDQRSASRRLQRELGLLPASTNADRRGRRARKTDKRTHARHRTRDKRHATRN